MRTRDQGSNPVLEVELPCLYNLTNPLLMPARSQLVALFRLAVLIIPSMVICRADPKLNERVFVVQSTESESSARPSNWRKELQSEIKFSLAAIVVPATPRVFSFQTPADPDTVVLSPYVVHEDRINLRKLDTDIRSIEAKAKATERAEAVARKLGIRVYGFQRDHFAMGVATVFYIPVFAGLGFSW